MNGFDGSASGDGKFFRILSLDGGGIRGVLPLRPSPQDRRAGQLGARSAVPAGHDSAKSQHLQ
jgi:hypothetical protein